MWITLTNFILFQIGWFACVMSGAANRPWIGAIVALIIVSFHLVRAHDREPELKLILIALGIGAMWDSLLVSQDWLKYDSGLILPSMAPYWIILLWGLFATILNVSLRWLRERWVMAALFGAIGGPLAYYGGYKLGALEFGNEKIAIIALAVGWAALTPLLMYVATRFDGYAQVLTERAS